MAAPRFFQDLLPPVYRKAEWGCPWFGGFSVGGPRYDSGRKQRDLVPVFQLRQRENQQHVSVPRCEVAGRAQRGVRGPGAQRMQPGTPALEGKCRERPNTSGYLRRF